jgi:hypothetical protein
METVVGIFGGLFENQRHQINATIVDFKSVEVYNVYSV